MCLKGEFPAGPRGKSLGQPSGAEVAEGLEGAAGRRSCGSAGAGGVASLQNTRVCVPSYL